MTFWTQSGFEPKRAFRFKVEIAGIEPFYVKSVTKPQFTIEEAEHKFLNRSYFFPGHVTWNPVTVTLVDDVGGWTVQALTDVMRRSNYGDIAGEGDISGLGQAKDKYRTIQKEAITKASSGTPTGTAPAAPSNELSGPQEILIKQLDSTGEITVEEITLYNGWIKSINPSELSYDSEDLSTYEVEIRYDWAKIIKP